MPFDRIQLSQESLVAAIGDGWTSDQIDAVIELLANSEGRFPSGARKLPSDLVRAVQRERLIVAMLKAAAELGYREANVQDVLDRAEVSRPTFYEHFANKEDCFLAAFDTSAERLRDKVEVAALQGGDVWRDRIRLGIEELLRFASTEPDTARAMIVEALRTSRQLGPRFESGRPDFFGGPRLRQKPGSCATPTLSMPRLPLAIAVLVRKTETWTFIRPTQPK